jgi:outer membrane receptor for ferrienterochelin and colicins
MQVMSTCDRQGEPSLFMSAMRLPLLLVSFILNSAAFAQSGPAPSPATPAPQPGSRAEAKSYVPADFARFAPRTALEMLSQIPGFTIRQESQERGLGQATGNVVINGQRISGKSNDVVTELGRVPIQSVERIEIVDGATLEIPGLSGQVANVIVRSSTISGQYAYRPEFRTHNTDPLLTRFETSVSGTRGAIEYTLGLDNRGSQRSGASGPTWIYSAAGNLLEDRDEHWKGNGEYPRISGRFAHDPAGASIGNLNFSLGRRIFDYIETGRRTPSAETARDRVVTIDEDRTHYEIGGDYAVALGPGQLKMIGLYRASSGPSITEVVSTAIDGSSTVGSRFARESDEAERIAKSEYRWTRGATEWQISAEGAFNSLDSPSRLYVLQPDGAFAEEPLAGGSARVTEDRYELMGSWGRQLAPTVTARVSLGGEYSELSQIGPGGQSRSFVRPKGTSTIAWRASPSTDVNLRLARRVGQLNFYDFLASVDLRDDTHTAANPDLVPQQSWELDLEGSRRFGWGTTTLRLFGKVIDDIIDFIPIGETGEAPGNLDQAIAYGFDVRSTLNLDRFGREGMRFDTHLVMQQTAVEDPLTGEQRRISNSLMRQASVGLRHDVPGTEIAWGGGLSYYLAAMSYRLTEVGRMWEGPVWDELFVEHKNLRGISVRATVVNLLGARSMWDRTVYTGRRTGGSVAFVEQRDRMIGPVFSFSIGGKF